MLCKDIRLADDFDFSSVSKLTPGYVGADLSSLVTEAAMSAVNRIFMSLEKELQSEEAAEVDGRYTCFPVACDFFC